MIFVRKKFGLFWAVFFCVFTVISHHNYFLTQCVIHGWKASDVRTNSILIITQRLRFERTRWDNFDSYIEVVQLVTRRSLCIARNSNERIIFVIIL